MLLSFVMPRQHRLVGVSQPGQPKSLMRCRKSLQAMRCRFQTGTRTNRPTSIPSTVSADNPSARGLLRDRSVRWVERA